MQVMHTGERCSSLLTAPKWKHQLLLAPQIVRHNGIEEMASLLLLVAEEEVDSRRSGARSIETGDSEGSGHSSAAAGSSPSVAWVVRV